MVVCQMTSLGEGKQGYPQADYLRGAATAARAVDVKPLVQAGLTGQALGEALKAERLKALEAYHLD